jgi:hypothetical protein
MRTVEEFRRACQWHAEGVATAEISRRLGVSRAQVRVWLTDPPAWTKGPPSEPCPMCAAVDRAHQLAPCYVYLLGLYLGDGSIAAMRRGVYKLRIFQDQRYVRLIGECIDAMAVVSGRIVGVQQKVGCVEIYAHSKHWPCLFPQHGPGRKHERPIVLVPWQQELVDRHPGMLVRGLIHSDGCRVTNPVHRPVAGQRKDYRYPRYFFSNVSRDIQGIFTDACDRLGVEWRRNRWNSISVARRDSVRRLDDLVGTKA